MQAILAYVRDEYSRLIQEDYKPTTWDLALLMPDRSNAQAENILKYSVYFLIYHETECVGFITVCPNDIDLSKPGCEAQMLYVTPKHRTKGIATDALNQVKANSLYVSTKNDRAIRLYESLGFEVAEETVSYVLMKRQL